MGSARHSGRALRAAVAAAALLAASPAAAQAARRVVERPAGGPAGTVVTLSGAGFRHQHRVRLSADHTLLRRVRADATGRFSARVRVPAAGGSSVMLVADDGRARTVSRFAISSAASARAASEVDAESGARLRWTPSLSRTPGGTALSGSGFPRRRAVQISGWATGPPCAPTGAGSSRSSSPFPEARWASSAAW